MAAAVETKVTAASAGTFVGSTGLLAMLQEVEDNTSLVGWMPGYLSPFVLALIPTVITFAAGWKAKHTPRLPR